MDQSVILFPSVSCRRSMTSIPYLWSLISATEYTLHLVYHLLARNFLLWWSQHLFCFCFLFESICHQCRTQSRNWAWWSSSPNAHQALLSLVQPIDPWIQKQSLDHCLLIRKTQKAWVSHPSCYLLRRNSFSFWLFHLLIVLKLELVHFCFEFDSSSFQWFRFCFLSFDQIFCLLCHQNWLICDPCCCRCHSILVSVFFLSFLDHLRNYLPLIQNHSIVVAVHVFVLSWWFAMIETEILVCCHFVFVEFLNLVFFGQLLLIDCHHQWLVFFVGEHQHCFVVENHSDNFVFRNYSVTIASHHEFLSIYSTSHLPKTHNHQTLHSNYLHLNHFCK